MWTALRAKGCLCPLRPNGMVGIHHAQADVVSWPDLCDPGQFSYLTRPAFYVVARGAAYPIGGSAIMTYKAVFDASQHGYEDFGRWRRS
jgi:hypothetical protein